MDVLQYQLLEEKAGEGKAAKAARLLFGPPAAPARRKGLGLDQCREHLVHADRLYSSPLREGGQTASKGLSKQVQHSQVALTDNHTKTRNASLEEGMDCQTGQ